MRKSPAPVRARVFRKLRVSLTRSCNFACPYCAPDGKAVRDPHATPMEKFLEWIDLLGTVQPLQQIRLTGGEPTLYPQLVPLVRALKQRTGAAVCLTTNGQLMSALAWPLKDAGLDGVNISLDAVEPGIFRQMGGRNYAAVIQGIHDAVAAGLSVKLNSTLMGEMNDSQILPILDFAYSQGIVARFLELMSMGHLLGSAGRRLVSVAEILGRISTRHEITALGRQSAGTAELYRLDRGQMFGIIANSSLPFCGDCDRLRLDSRGQIYGCLSSNRSHSLDSGVPVRDLLGLAMKDKQTDRFTGSALSMREVGG